MSWSLTDSLKQNRLTVVAVDQAAGRIRVRSEAEMCSDLSCEGTLVVSDEGQGQDLSTINAGDIITMEMKDGRPSQIRVVRRVYDEYSSPEW
jgi:hypothetical protein